MNRSPGSGYVERWADFVLLPGFVEALKAVAARGYASVVVTNQRGVARGCMTRAALETIHRNLIDVLRTQYGLELTDILYCPHGENECNCRKPKPGMFREAARRHRLDLNRSWMVGDRLSDIVAGKAAGCATIFIGVDDEDGGADYRVATVDELAPLLKQVLDNRSEEP